MSCKTRSHADSTRCAAGGRESLRWLRRWSKSARYGPLTPAFSLPWGIPEPPTVQNGAGQGHSHHLTLSLTHLFAFPQPFKSGGSPGWMNQALRKQPQTWLNFRSIRAALAGGFSYAQPLRTRLRGHRIAPGGCGRFWRMPVPGSWGTGV